MTDEPIEPAQARKLELEIEKLEIDIEKLKESKFFDKWLSKIIPILPFLLGAAAFIFGVYQYNKQQEAALFQRQMALEQQAREAQTSAQQRQLEIIKPFLEKQSALYFEASNAAATIATATDSKERSKAEHKFRELYTGQMVVVEDPGVESAMINFHMCLVAEPQCDESEMKIRSLSLASSIRESLKTSFGLSLQDLKGKH